MKYDNLNGNYSSILFYDLGVITIFLLPLTVPFCYLDLLFQILVALEDSHCKPLRAASGWTRGSILPSLLEVILYNGSRE